MMSHREIKSINGKRVATPEYRAWQQLKNRILNPKSANFRHYGGRGLGMDPRWKKFENFLADMGRRPDPSLTLERKDVNVGYFKSNCEWATRQTQARNRNYCKLTLADARVIRHLYKTGNYYQRELASMYGVTQVLISKVVLDQAWAE